MDFLFDTLLHSMSEIITNNLLISYLSQCGYKIANLMSISFEYNGTFIRDDINQQQYKMVTELSKFGNKHIWNKDRNSITPKNPNSSIPLLLKQKGIV